MARPRIRLEAQKGDCSISEHRVDPIERRRPVAVKVRFEGGDALRALGAETVTVVSRITKRRLMDVGDTACCEPFGKPALGKAALAADRVLADVDEH
jgi:hypothetical protein